MTGAIIVFLIGMIALVGLLRFLFPENFAHILDRINTLVNAIIDTYDLFIIKVFGTEEHRNTKAKFKEEQRQVKNQEKARQAKIQEEQRQVRMREEQHEARLQEAQRQSKLSACIDCGSTVSKMAESCPKCGRLSESAIANQKKALRYQKKQSENISCITSCLVVIFVLFFAFIILPFLVFLLISH